MIVEDEFANSGSSRKQDLRPLRLVSLTSMVVQGDGGVTGGATDSRHAF